MIWSVAWRNIWRNPFRSGVLITATALGMFAGIFSISFMKGWMNQRVESAVDTEFSYLQIHHPSFTENYDYNLLMPDGVDISNQLKEMPEIKGASPRIVLQSMVSSAETGTGVKINGIFPDREKITSNLYTFIKEGDFFDGQGRYPVVIGEKLAKKLKVKLKSKIVITLQDAGGNIVSGAFRVTGIFNIINNVFEESNLFVRYEDLENLTHLPVGIAHEITISIREPDKVESIKSEISSKYPKAEVLTWKQITPELSFIVGIGNMYVYIFVVIVLLALGFGIVNTMLMVVLERVKELGMLMAVGMDKSRVFLMLMLETVLLTFTGGAIGIAGGLAFCMALMKNGIDLSMYAQGFEELGRSSVIRPVLEVKMIVIVCTLVIITGILASIFPARKAIRYNPADAIRIDM